MLGQKHEKEFHKAADLPTTGPGTTALVLFKLSLKFGGIKLRTEILKRKTSYYPSLIGSLALFLTIELNPGKIKSFYLDSWTSDS